MNILLLEGLPYEYEDIPISPDFRNMIQVDMILSDPDMPERDKVINALYQLYPEIPSDISMAEKGLHWFFSRGRVDEDDSSVSSASNKKGFDFGQDANYIFAAFYATYHISLSTIEFLHWWEFMALFEALPETTLIKKIMYYRTANTAGMPKSERQHVEKMRALFPLKCREKEPLSIEELERQTKARAAKRVEEAQRRRTAGM